MMRIAPQKNVVRGAVTVSLLVILIFLGKALLDRRQHMQTDATSAPDRNLIEATVTIQRPVNEVFGFYRDFKNLPNFLGDVMAIEPTGPATSRWTIEGPFGIRAHWTVEVTEVRENEMIRYETVTSPTTRTYWDYPFCTGNRAWGDASSRSNESTWRKTCTGCPCVDRKIPRPGSISESAQIQAKSWRREK
jgi:Polyketide cyclase / dehydrase and lipid transport